MPGRRTQCILIYGKGALGDMCLPMPAWEAVYLAVPQQVGGGGRTYGT